MSLPDLSALHFVRPGCLLAALPLPLLMGWWLRQRRLRSAWRESVDPHLLPYVLEKQGGGKGARLGVWLAAFAYLLTVLALAGPSWRQSAQPLWQSQTPLVIALDLSSATSAADTPPSRLARARAKLAVLLRERKSGQVGLVAYARDAFTVAPLTDDAANVALFLDSLQPDVMPRDGQNTGEAISWSAQLLQRAGAPRGDIIVLTDHADEGAVSAAADAAAAGYRVSALGLGTEAGAAYRRESGEIASARLDTASLQRLASNGNGRYASLDERNEDLRRLGVLDPGASGAAGGTADGLAWQDEGYWLLPPLMLLALLAFRRGGAVALLLVCCVLPLHEAKAADLWRRPDQAAYLRMQQGNEAYRRGDYAAAAREYQTLDSATAHYNRGNALAKTGQYPQAIAAYDEALRRQPGMADALANKRAVEAAMKRKPPPGADGGQGKSQQQQGGQSQQQNPQQRSQSSQQQQNPPQDSQQPGAQQRKQEASREKSQSEQAQSQPAPSKPQDAKAQAEADRAQRERMQKALQDRTARAGRDPQQAKPEAEETPEQRERRLANEAWLRRVPDDPGGLLRAKFRLELERRASKGKVEQ